MDVDRVVLAARRLAARAELVVRAVAFDHQREHEVLVANQKRRRAKKYLSIELVLAR